jgi:type I restriction enzyme S subunit
MAMLMKMMLNDICELIVDCEHKTAPIQETGYPSIRTPNVGRGRLILDGVNRVSEETYRRWSQRAVPQTDDIILAREAPLGNAAIIPPNLDVCLGQRTVLIRPNKNKVDPHYLVYLLLGDEIQGQFHGLGAGATVPHLNMKDIRELPLPKLPPLSVQQRIGAFLAAYDDLIENNTRRIKALEQVAHDLYREWFVEFRFSGHESVPLVESGTDYGMIPQGWEVLPVSQAIEINPRIAVVKDAEKPFIEMARLSENSMLIDTRDMEFRTTNNGSKFQNYDTLFARITPCLENGKTGYVNFLANGNVALGSTEFVVMRSRTLTPEYVYCLSRLSDFRAAAQKTMTGASGRQRVQNTFFDSYLVVQPSQDVLREFQGMAAPLFDQISVLAQKNDALREARDLLLPRLVSGELDVSEVELGGIRDV